MGFGFGKSISRGSTLSQLGCVFSLGFSLGGFCGCLSGRTRLSRVSGFYGKLELFLTPGPFRYIVSSVYSTGGSVGE